MKIFHEDRLDTTAPYLLKLWTSGLKDSFAKINSYDLKGDTMMDSAGSDGWLGGVVANPDNYYLVDIDQAALDKFEGKNKFLSSVEEQPFEDEKFDLIVSVSSLQYINHDNYLTECHRTLKPGGYLCIHENGAYNPFINLTRVWRSVVSLYDPEWREYKNTVQKYLVKSTLTNRDDFELVYEKNHLLLSSISWMVEWLGFKKAGSALEAVLLPIDNFLIKVPGLNKLGFLNVYHLKKI
jgi:SAM-dependent methyltransferase